MSERKNQSYMVCLTVEEQEKLKQLVKTGTAPARTIMRANVLLATDGNRNSGRLSAQKIAELYHIHPLTVHDIRKQFSQQGLDKTIHRKKRNTPPPPKVTGDVEAKIIALACSEPPDGRTRWTLELLSDKSVELKIVDSISHEKVRQVLKKRT